MCSTYSNETAAGTSEGGVVFQHSDAVSHAVCSLTLAALGTLGNGLSIFLIFRGRLHTTGLTMLLLVDLCVTQLVYTAFILPLIGVSNIRGDDGTWVFSGDFCAAFGFIMYATLSSEIGLMLAITVNQYFIVVRNFNTQNWLMRSHRNLKLFVVLSLPWLPGLVYIAPLTRQWDEFGFEPRKGYCSLRNLSGSHSIKPTVNFAYIVIIAIAILFCYARIYWTHHKSRVRTDAMMTLNSNTTNTTTTPNTITTTTTTTAPNNSTTTTTTKKSSSSSTTTPSSSTSPQNTRNSNRSARSFQLAKMISLIIVNFFFTYIPFMIKTAVDPCLERTPVGVTTAIIYISWSHVATNPFIYALGNRQIRSQWRHLLLPCHTRRTLTFASTYDDDGQTVVGGGAGGRGGGGRHTMIKAATTKNEKEDTIAVLENGNGR